MRWKLLLAAALTSVAAPALAGPWIEAGDVQVREDVERLKAARIIVGPTNAWPLPWAVMSDLATAAEDMQLAPDLRAAAKRLVSVAALADQPNSGEAKVMVTDRPALIRDFGAGAREDFDGSVRVTQQMGRLFVSLGGGYRRHQYGRDFHLDQSYAALALGNWAFYGGYVDHWWGRATAGPCCFPPPPGRCRKSVSSVLKRIRSTFRCCAGWVHGGSMSLLAMRASGAIIITPK